MSDETSLWKGSPSQWLNLGPFTAALIAAVGIAIGSLFFPPGFIALIIPLGYMIWKYLVVRTSVFELTSERLRITKGILNQKIDEIELYRVKDSQMVRPWWMRLTGLASIRHGNVRPHDADSCHPRRSRRGGYPGIAAQACGTPAGSQTRPRDGFRRARR